MRWRIGTAAPSARAARRGPRRRSSAAAGTAARPTLPDGACGSCPTNIRPCASRGTPPAAASGGSRAWAAGARPRGWARRSLSPPHSQLIALPMVPKRTSEEMDAAEHYFARQGTCVYCDLIAQELAGRERVVYENECFIAVAPFAARFPFETWILPKAHMASFGGISAEDVPAMAHVLKTTLLKLALCLGNPPYNYIVHSAPYGSPSSPAYHWHVEIMPQLTRAAGFEWGSGFHINPVAPEDAARYLRETEVREQVS